MAEESATMTLETDDRNVPATDWGGMDATQRDAYVVSLHDKLAAEKAEEAEASPEPVFKAPPVPTDIAMNTIDTTERINTAPTAAATSLISIPSVSNPSPPRR